MIDFPSIKREHAATRNGNFYVQRDNGKWYKMELYLPAATGTYRESLEETANRFLDDIESGAKPFKFAITENGNYDSKSYTARVENWFK